MIQRFEHKGLTLEYEVLGTGIPFLFLHGLGGSIEQIHKTYLPHDNLQLILLNQQGHGNSEADWEHYDFDRLTDDAVALLDHLQIDRAIVGGISMGAAVSLNMAIRYPDRVRALLLIRNAWLNGPMDRDRVLVYQDLGTHLHKGDLESFQKSAGWEIVREPSAYTRGTFCNPFQEPSNVKNWQKFMLLPAKQPFRSIEELNRITVPVTILACRDDLFHPFGYGVWMKEHIPHATFLEIPSKDADSDTHKLMINEAITAISHAK